MSEADVEKISNEENRYDGYEDVDCPKFTELCRRFYCGMYDHECDKECKLVDKTLPLFLCQICDLNDEKECPKRIRVYIHKEFVPRGKITKEMGDSNVTRDEMETELALLRREKEGCLQKYRLESKAKTKRKLLREHDAIEKQVQMLERLLRYKKNEDLYEKLDDRKEPQGTSVKSKFKGLLKKDPLSDGKNSLEQFKKILFWVIAIGAGLAWYFTS